MHSICAAVLQFAATFPTKSVDIRSCWQVVALHHCSSAPIQEVIPQKKELEIVPNCRDVSTQSTGNAMLDRLKQCHVATRPNLLRFMQDTGSVANRQRGLYPAELIRKIFTILGCPCPISLSSFLQKESGFVSTERCSEIALVRTYHHHCAGLACRVGLTSEISAISKPKLAKAFHTPDVWSWVPGLVHISHDTNATPVANPILHTAV